MRDLACRDVGGGAQQVQAHHTQQHAQSWSHGANERRSAAMWIENYGPEDVRARVRTAAVNLVEALNRVALGAIAYLRSRLTARFRR